MAVKVAINGFGRIGRNVLRAIIESGRTDIEVVAINDLGPVDTNAHLLRYDSVHGKFPAKVKTTKNTIDVGRGKMQVTAIRNPKELPWDGVDIALECTGFFASKDGASQHLENGSKRVLISAPGGSDIPTIVYGLFALITVGPLLRDYFAQPLGLGQSSSSVMTRGGANPNMSPSNMRVMSPRR